MYVCMYVCTYVKALTYTPKKAINSGLETVHTHIHAYTYVCMLETVHTHTRIYVRMYIKDIHLHARTGHLAGLGHESA